MFIKILCGFICFFGVAGQSMLFCQDHWDNQQALLNGHWNCTRIVSRVGEFKPKNLSIDIAVGEVTATYDPKLTGIRPITERYHITLSRIRRYVLGSHWADLEIRQNKDTDLLPVVGFIQLKDDTLLLKVVPDEEKEIDIEIGFAFTALSVIADMREERRKSEMIVREPGSFILHLKKATK